MHEVHPVTGLSFDYEEDPVTTTAWVTQRGKKNEAKKDDRVPETVENPIVETASDDMLQFTTEDVKEEVEYWSQAVYCFVLGANPPWEVLNGFIHRIWSKYGIDKVSFLPNRVFLVRFKEVKDREAILAAGYHMFDINPLIVKPWQVDVDLLKEDVKVVPAWVRLHGLPLKFWGKCLPSIAGLVGKYIKKDVTTDEKMRLGFARTMVELTVGQKFPSSFKFKNEQGQIVVINVEYEWKPSICTKCKGMGHEENNCRKMFQKAKPMQKVWKPIPKPAATDTNGTPGKKLSTPIKTTQENLATQSGKSGPIQENLVHQNGRGSSSDQTPQQVVVVDTETKINAGNVSHISHNLFDGWCVTTNCHTHKGGRGWLIWQPSSFDILILQYNPQFIHVQYNGPYALAGDFNTIIHPDERMGGQTRQEDMEDFLNCLGLCEMTDIPATGAFYTWNNKQDAEHRKYNRLDRFLINQEWVERIPDMAAHFHHEGLLYHTPCVASNIKLNNGKARSFKYFNMWSSAPAFLPTVKEELKYKLKALNKECFSDIENQTSQTAHLLAEVQVQIAASDQNAELIAKEVNLMNELRNLTKARDCFLQQKSKVQWMEEGDANTAYFHCAIKKRCLRNKVIQIEDKEGQLCTDTETIENAFLAYYEDLLGKKSPTEEVKADAVFSIPKDKAPGPDGYSSGFFRDTWDLIGKDVYAAVVDFFNTGQLLQQINATNITLIPKCDRPTSVKQFRHIACCNMIYKVISKLLCNRLAPVLPDLIHDNQGAFIQGRSIIENVLICHDIVHMYARSHVSPRCLFKIDLQKAYDTVE
ncbi:uncharacterized protein LOC141607821 [Silene latifolia]|uniref:uncharacterized protein LOC141607821 n=1 Tax=Silene latifolia TaxID=37657 RepID=UPI003D76C078